MAPGPGSRTRTIIKKPLVFMLFQKKMVLAFEFWGPPFHFLTNASANLLVLLENLVWPHNSASSATWRLMEIQKDYKDHQGYSKHKWWETYNLFLDVILRLPEALVCFRASRDNFLRSITRAIVNKMLGNVKLIFWRYFETFRSSRLFSRLWG